MQRLLKVLTGQSSAIDSLERKLREMQAPKKKTKQIVEAIDTRNILRKSQTGNMAIKDKEYNEQEIDFGDGEVVEEEGLDLSF